MIRKNKTDNAKANHNGIKGGGSKSAVGEGSNVYIKYLESDGVGVSKIQSDQTGGVISRILTRLIKRRL